MSSRIFFLPLLALVLAGCVLWDAGYTENKPVSMYAVPQDEKVSISYSVSVEIERDDDDEVAFPTWSSLREKIEEALRATGMFSEVVYAAKGGEDSYHIEFSFHQAGTNAEEAQAIGFLAGYTFVLVPTGEILTFDGSAVLSIQGKPIYSTAKSEELRRLIWLPMAPIGVFMNDWVVWHFAEKGTVDALCEEIAQEHRRRFLQNAKITKIVEE